MQMNLHQQIVNYAPICLFCSQAQVGEVLLSFLFEEIYIVGLLQSSFA